MTGAEITKYMLICRHISLSEWYKMGKVRVAVIGASGFTGLELIKMLLNHPCFEIAFLGGSEGGAEIAALHPMLEKIYSRQVEKSEIDRIANEAQLAFLAVPHKQATTIAKQLLERGVKVVDLSADYRLAAQTYEAAYGGAHEDTANLAHAVYGLPELVGAQAIANARLIANPGCYPTASLLAILPFAEYIDTDQPIIIDAKSGVSGAGKACIERTHFVTVNENCFTYSPITHRHAPEISEKAAMALDHAVQVVFVPHLLPITRGMLASVYIKLKKPLENPTERLREFYKDNQFVRVRNDSVQIKFVAGTHFADIFAIKDGETLFVQTAIDNLLRGASSSAIANANLMFGCDPSASLPQLAHGV
ncbi:N-acetyl-gamma-glutamyl-phosphate reductase [Campylobacterota bacterium]|nr:N-acetyl-gamma-glutamyl-phosphate reductase [Campylobacterota bacterium]